MKIKFDSLENQDEKMDQLSSKINFLGSINIDQTETVNDIIDNNINDINRFRDEPETIQSCLSLRKDGKPCGRQTKPGEPYCFFHISTCVAITSKGTKCSNGCMEDTNRCSYHAATCPGITKNGSPCQLAAEFCRYHKYQDQRSSTTSTSTSTSTSVPTSTSTSTSTSISIDTKTQCRGMTKKGQRCRRKVSDNEDFCHFHQ